MIQRCLQFWLRPGRGIWLLAGFVGAGCVYAWSLPPTLKIIDEAEYLYLSRHLLHGPGFSLDGHTLTASRPPGYPLFLALLQLGGSGLTGFRIVQFLLLGATLALLPRLVTAPEGGRLPLAIVVALAVAYPVLFYTAGTLYPQTLAGFLLVLSLTGLLRGGASHIGDLRTDGLPTGGAGLCFGGLILTVPTFLLTLPLVAGLGVLLRLVAVPRALLFIGVALLPLLGWGTRNYLVFHEIIPISSNGGLNFLIGNCENTYPSGGGSNIDTGRYQAEADARGLNEFERDRYFRQAAWTWIEAHPARAGLLYLGKALNFFSPVNDYDTHLGAVFSPGKQVVLALTYLFLLGLLVWRVALVRSLPWQRRELFLLGLYLLSAFAAAIFFTRIRHRLPFDGLLLAVLALFVHQRLKPGGEVSRD